MVENSYAFANYFSIQVDVHAGMLYDALLLWAYGVNKTIEDNASYVDDGKKITQKILEGITFNGMLLMILIPRENPRTRPPWNLVPRPPSSTFPLNCPQ